MPATKLAELNERRILPNDGIVTWFRATDPRGDYHMVQLLDRDGYCLHRWTTPDYATARSAYDHPWADPNVVPRDTGNDNDGA